MYYPYFIAYMVAGFLISLPVLWWAFHNGQFRDQARARFLPLEDEPDAQPATVSKINRIEAYALLAVMCTGLLLSAAVLAVSLIRFG